MRKLILTLMLAAVLVLAGCEGWGGKAACKRLPDGTMECTVESHRDKKH